MRKDWRQTKDKLLKWIEARKEYCTGAYAAQSAYFFVLSMIPILLLLLTLVQFTPATKEDVVQAVVNIFPSSINVLIVSIINTVYGQSSSIIPITAVVAVWSAGKGVLAVTSGLNRVYRIEETRNYIFLRIRASFYTIVFIAAIVFSLLLPVFGNRLSIFIARYVPFMIRIASELLRIRPVLSFVVLTAFWVLVYRFLPNRKDRLCHQIPGAIFTACMWLLISFAFSVYLDIFTGFSSMYGSMTTIILLLLWLYGCMYAVLLGGEVNVWYAGKTKEEKKKAPGPDKLDGKKRADRKK